MLRAPSLGLARRVSSTLGPCSRRASTSFAPQMTAPPVRRRANDAPRRDTPAPHYFTIAEIQRAEDATLEYAYGAQPQDTGDAECAPRDAAEEAPEAKETRPKRSHAEWCRLARLRIRHKERRERQIARYFTPPPILDKSPPYPAGPFAPLPVKPLAVGPDGLGEVVYEPSDDLVFMRDPPPDPAALSATQRAVLRADLLFFLQYTQSADDAWRAYSLLLALPAPPYPTRHHTIPNAHLHRVARVLAHARPKTRSRFLRLLSVLACLARQGGRVLPHEWNALIDGAAKGWRKTRAADVRLAFDTFADMTEGRAPGASALAEDDAEGGGGEPQRVAPTKPDIYTYTTLLSAAARTLDPATVRAATHLLKSSGLTPNRVTHLALLNYYTYTGQLSGVRATLRQLRLEGHPLGLDGLNAALWAFARNGRIDIVADAYRVLRHRLHHADDDAATTALATRLRDTEALDLAPALRPNAATWTALVQAFAHHGDLPRALGALRDMLGQENAERGAPLHADGRRAHYAPALPVLRALVLGFARHGAARGGPWSLRALRPVLRVFLALPAEPRASRGTVFWVLTAVRKTAGGRRGAVREVWEALEARYGEGYMVSQQRLRALREWLYHDEEGADEGEE